MQMTNETTTVYTVEWRVSGNLYSESIKWATITVTNDTEFEIKSSLFPFSSTFSKTGAIYIE